MVGGSTRYLGYPFEIGYEREIIIWACMLDLDLNQDERVCRVETIKSRNPYIASKLEIPQNDSFE